MSRILLGSGGFRGTGRFDFMVSTMQAFFGSIEKILFVPFALADHDDYVDKLTEKGLNAGYVLDGIHHKADPEAAVREAEGIYIGGGNTFRLIDQLYRSNLLSPIREAVMGGLPYLGISAGTNVACPTMMTTNDMPIVYPPSFDALGVVPFQVNAHYFSGSTYLQEGEEYLKHFGETRDDRIAEFHEVNDTTVIGLREGSFLEVVDGEVTLSGSPARLFVKGSDAVDVDPGMFDLPG